MWSFMARSYVRSVRPSIGTNVAGHETIEIIEMSTPEAIVGCARGWLGTPYHHQASVKGVGCDCLGLIRGVWRELCGPEPEAMPAYTRDWGNARGRRR